MWLEKCGPKNEIFDCLSSTSVFDLYGLDRLGIRLRERFYRKL